MPKLVKVFDLVVQDCRAQHYIAGCLELFYGVWCGGFSEVGQYSLQRTEYHLLLPSQMMSRRSLDLIKASNQSATTPSSEAASLASHEGIATLGVTPVPSLVRKSAEIAN